MEKEIKGFENYTINDSGDNYKTVYSLKNQKYLKPHIANNGYYCVSLSKNGKVKLCTLHRLIATHFIDNPDDKPCIDHINGCRTDNRVQNLRWVTHKENMENPISRERCSKAQTKRFETEDVWNKGTHIRPEGSGVPTRMVAQYSLDGELIGIYNSLTEAVNENNLGSCGALSAVCKGGYGRKTYGGFIWKYYSSN